MIWLVSVTTGVPYLLSLPETLCAQENHRSSSQIHSEFLFFSWSHDVMDKISDLDSEDLSSGSTLYIWLGE